MDLSGSSKDQVGGPEGVEEMKFEELFKNRLHPLYIPSVVTDVCKFLSIKDLGNVRAINGLWNTESVSVLRKTRVVEISNLAELIRYNKCMVDTVDFPHTSYKLWTDDIAEVKHLNNFFENFGSHIKHLNISSLFKRLISLKGDYIFQILSKKVPNLESLTFRSLPSGLSSPPNPPVQFLKLKSINFIWLSSQESWNLSLSFLQDLSNAVPNLERISVIKDIGKPQRQLEPFLPPCTFFYHILNHPQPMRYLNCLDFPLRLTETHIELLIEKAFPLQSLDISLDFGVTPKTFASFLAGLKRTITNLCLTLDSNSFHPLATTSTVAQLTNLTSLTLTKFNGTLLFIEDMPALRTLILHEIDLNTALPLSSFRKTSEKYSHQLSTFISSADASDSDVVNRIARCFPNLSVLHLDKVEDEGLAVIYLELPFITELFLTNGTFTDTGISGVPPEVCIDLWETMTVFEVVPEHFRKHLYIGSLSHLRRVKLESHKMTDTAIVFGLMSCTKLNCLYLKSNEITDIAMPAIGRKLRDLILLDAKHCPQVSEAITSLILNKK